jgi:FMN reductase
MSQIQTKHSENRAVDISGLEAAVLLINGSPSTTSKTGAVLGLIASHLKAEGITVKQVSVLDFEPEDLLFGNFQSESIRRFTEQISKAEVVVVGTPVYKASYSGVLKTILDVISPGALAGKGVLALATAGSPSHFLILDYALKPVLSFLGTRTFLGNIFLIDQDIRFDQGQLVLDRDANERLKSAVAEILSRAKSNPKNLKTGGEISA